MTTLLRPTILQSCLPATIEGQQSLITSLAFSAAFGRIGNAEPVFESLRTLEATREPLPEIRLSSLLEDAFTNASSWNREWPKRLFLPAAMSDGLACIEAASSENRLMQGQGDSDSNTQAVPPRVRSVETPDQFCSLLEAEFLKAEKLLQQSAHLLFREEIVEIESEIRLIRSRLDYWKQSLKTLPEYFGSALINFRDDAFFGLRLLLHRVFELQSRLFSDSVPAVEAEGPTSLFERSRLELEDQDVLPALRNRSIGYGPDLMLREHQEFIWARVRGLLRKLVQEREEDEKSLRPLMRNGTVVMPQGAGKTRTMVACLAAAIEVGLFDAKRGDKMFILNHTTQIHNQNVKVSGLLGYYFQQKFGREIRISEYKADNKDLTGDVIILNIPTIAEQGARDAFEADLENELGKDGSVAIAAIDEIHHLEIGSKRSDWKESWRGAVASLENVSPRSLFRVGFTATPTGQEGPYIGRLRFVDLMRSGVTPRLYLYQIEGVDLDALKVSVDSGGVDDRKMVSVLLDHPKRNQRIFEALEKLGLRAETPSSSERARLQPTLFFGFDLAHASMMAKSYSAYFRQDGNGDLRRREIAVLGQNDGQIAKADLQVALEAYRKGDIDGIAAVVSKDTPLSLRKAILKAGEDGEIEAVFNVKLWGEGADLPWITHQVGAKPSFSVIDKAQEMGRSNRRSDSEVSAEGRLLKDRPRILFDVVDRLHSHDRHLIHYANLLGFRGGAIGVLGKLFDVFNGCSADQVDTDGKHLSHFRLPEIVKDKKKRNERPFRPRHQPESDVSSLVQKLRTILEISYQGDLEALAADLGLDSDKTEDLLEGRGWIEERWYLRRLATLLYQQRESFVNVFNQRRGVATEVRQADVNLLRAGLAVFARREGLTRESSALIDIQVDLPLWGRHRAVLSRHSQSKLMEGTLTDRIWWQITSALYLYFSSEASQGKQVQEQREEASAWKERIKAYAYERKQWTDGVMPAQDHLRSLAREAVLILWGGRIPQNHGVAGLSRGDDKSSLTRWLQRDAIVYGKTLTPSYHYGQVRILLRHARLVESEIRKHIVAAVYEERGWKSGTATGRAKSEADLRKRARDLVAYEFGGALPFEHGIAGVSSQTGTLRNAETKGPTSHLTRWIDGEMVAEIAQGAAGTALQGEIRSLLLHFGEKSSDLKKLLVSAFGETPAPPPQRTAEERRRDAIDEIYVKKSWRPDEATRQGEFRRVVRSVVAECSAGVPPGEWDSLFARWIRGEDLSNAREFDVSRMFVQVEKYLQAQGRFDEETAAKLNDAVRELLGWQNDVDTAGGRLRALARQVVIQAFRGRLPMHHGIPGIPMQDYAADGTPKSMLASWLNGQTVAFGYSVTVEEFYGQIQCLLAYGRIPEDSRDARVISAVYEQQGWKDDLSTADGRLKKAVRKRIALRYGGQLPLDPKIPGLKRQKRDRSGDASRTSPLIRWIRGDAPDFYHSSTRREFEAQLRILSLALGINPEVIDAAYPKAA